MEDGSSVDSAISGDDAGILPTPGYMEMVKRVAEVQWRLVSNIPTGFSYYEQLKTYCHYTWFDASLILGFAVLWTILRSSLTSNVYKPILNRLQLDDKQNVVKAPESMFKSFWYLFSWSYTYYVLFNGKYDIFQNPAAIFEDWSNGMTVPWDIYILYMYQCGFYLHSIYATIYVDVIRNDFYLMIVHHVLTVVLIGFSYLIRYHKIGLLVIFCHDLTDIFLEFAKICVYTKHRKGREYNSNENAANVLFFGFMCSWYVLRLYWYPLKVLYSAGAFTTAAMPCITSFNVMLWLLQLINVYWFMVILHFLLRMVTGQVDGIHDTREETGKGKKTGTVTNDIQQNTEDLNNHQSSNKMQDNIPNGVDGVARMRKKAK